MKRSWRRHPGPTDFPRCGVPGCGRSRSRAYPVCGAHWKAVPDDLRERLKWARDEETMADYVAAVHAVITEAAAVELDSAEFGSPSG